MTLADRARARLANQQLTVHTCATPQAVVSAFGALQGQDYRSALWAVGVRLAEASESGIEQALARADIVRTWAMRGTLHLVSARDVRWILGLLAPREIARSASRRRQLEIDDEALTVSRRVLAGALSGGGELARDEAFGLLGRAGVETAGQRGIHILRHLSLEGLLCQTGARRGQATFVLLDARVPPSRIADREEGLGELAHRYFSSHGPATLRDFGWWSGLTVADARVGLALAADRLVSAAAGDTMYWMPGESPAAGTPAAASRKHTVSILPGFDEYILGYRDREVALDAAAASRIVPGGNGVFLPAVVADGRVVGTWRPRRAGRPASIAELFAPLDAAASRKLDQALASYDRFVEPTRTPGS